jgi:hypothetical protein
MDDEVNKLHGLVANSGAEFSLAVVNAFEALYVRRSEAEVRGLVEQCHSTAAEYEANLNTLLAAMNRDPVKYAREITRIYWHKVLKQRALDSLLAPMKAPSGNTEETHALPATPRNFD